MERMEEMLLLSRQLDFGGCKAVPLISASRWLVKKGELTRLLWKETDTYRRSHRRPHKQTLHLFLFTDLLVVTKKKSGEEASGTFTVLDHCPRNMVQIQEVEECDLPGKLPEAIPRNLLHLTILENREGKTVDMVRDREKVCVHANVYAFI